MGTPPLHYLCLFATMARAIRDVGRPTYTSVYDKIRRDAQRAGGPQPFWIRDLKPYSLQRCARSMRNHFRQEVIIQGDGGLLTLSPFGKRLAALFQPALEQVHSLYGVGPSAGPLKVRIADSLASEVLPGAIRRLREQRGDLPCFLFRRMIDYQSLDDEVGDREVEFGLGWQVEGRDWRRARPVPLGDPVRMVFVVSRGALLAAAPTAAQFRDAVSPSYPLFVVRGDLAFPSFEEALGRLGFGPDRVVEVVNFQAVLTHARRDDGVGIVPLLPWVVDRLRQKGLIDYTDVPGMPPQQITCYLPRSGEDRLDERARRLLAAIRQNLHDLLNGQAPGEPGEGRRRQPRRPRT